MGLSFFHWFVGACLSVWISCLLSSPLFPLGYLCFADCVWGALSLWTVVLSCSKRSEYRLLGWRSCLKSVDGVISRIDLSATHAQKGSFMAPWALVLPRKTLPNLQVQKFVPYFSLCFYRLFRFRILISLKFITVHAVEWIANFTVFEMPVSSPNCLRNVCAVSFLLLLPAPLLLIWGLFLCLLHEDEGCLSSSSEKFCWDFACHCAYDCSVASVVSDSLRPHGL